MDSTLWEENINKGGYCTGIVTTWIVKSLQENSLFTDKNFLRRVGIDRHKFYRKFSSNSGVKDIVTGYFTRTDGVYATKKAYPDHLKVIQSGPHQMTTQPDDSTAAAMADDIVTTLCTENYLHIGFFDGNADIGHAIGFIKRGRWIYILDPNQYCISTTSTKDLKTLIGDSEFCEQGSGVYYKWVIKKREGGSFDKYYL